MVSFLFQHSHFQIGGSFGKVWFGKAELTAWNTMTKDQLGEDTNWKGDGMLQVKQPAFCRSLTCHMMQIPSF